MSWFSKLFKQKPTFVGDPVNTGDELLALAASNEVVAAELTEFEKRIADKSCAGRQDQEAFKSAEALSGYGILVSKKAFLETIE